MSDFNQFIYKVIFGFIICLLFTSEIQAQSITTTKPIEYYRSIWAEAGVGIAGKGLAAQYSINAEVGQGWFLSYSQNFIDEAFVQSWKTVDYHDVKSTSYCLGKTIKSKHYLFSYALGISKSTIDTYRPYSLDEINNVTGFAGRVNFIAGPSFISGGGSFYLNINSEYSYAGITMSLGLGSLHIRKRKKD